MKQLILSELKKIFKSKTICLLITAFMIFSVYNAYLAIFGQENSSIEYKNLNGEQVSSATTIMDANKNMHKYVGEWSQDKNKQIKDDAKEMLSQLSIESIDFEKMKQVYGDEYQTVIDISDGKQTMNHDQFIEFSGKFIPEEIEFQFDGENIIPMVYYKDIDKLNYLLLLFDHTYYSNRNVENLKTGYSITNGLDSILIDKKIDKQIIDEFEKENDIKGSDAELFEEYINEKIQEMPANFDSSISKDILITNIEPLFLVAILVIVVVIADLFGIESKYDVDQIIYPTKSTKFKITVAKIVSAFLVALGILWVSALIYFIMFYIFLPPYTWNMIFMSENLLLHSFTYQYVMFYGIILASLSALVITTMCILLSYIIKSRFVVVIILFAFIALSWRMMGDGFVSFFLPTQMSMFTIFFQSGPGCFPYMFMNNSIIPMRTIVTIGWSLVIALICGSIIFHSRKSYIKS